jgi:methionyl aminopeptidase
LIRKKGAEEIARIRASCRIVFLVQQALQERIRPGVTTRQLDTLAEEIIRAHGAVPAFKGYRGYPATICTSANTQVVHGIPDGTSLQEGDILSVDVGVRLDGYYGDGAFTVGVGQIDPEARHLIETTRDCLELGIAQARAGNRLSDISHAVQRCAESRGLAVIRQFGGHGIGRALHEEPHIDNYGPPGRGPRLETGYVLAIEPILSLGDSELTVAGDGWTTTTQDGKRTAHCEHTIAVTEQEPEILTLSPPAARPPRGKTP